MSILKMVLAILIAFFIIVGIILVAVIVIGYYWGQILQQQVRETMSNSYSSSPTPSECIQNPNDVLCQLALAKQKVEQLQNR
ncbi:hypothetical protein BH18THE1_BH18THE1_02850 [soil metagenome]